MSLVYLRALGGDKIKKESIHCPRARVEVRPCGSLYLNCVLGSRFLQ